MSLQARSDASSRMSAPRLLLLALLLAAGVSLAAPAPAGAVDVPPEGSCPPYPVPRTGDGAPQDEDVVPPLFRPGDQIPFDQLPRIARFLPPEVWERRDVFFYDGMQLELGPCHRRYPAPAFFEKATEESARTVALDEQGNLIDYAGLGLPFPWQSIADDDPQAALKWAWNSRYRYQGAGYRGKFRILHVARRGRKIERFTGSFYVYPMNGVPGSPVSDSDSRFWAGGSFKTPALARGVAWRQLRLAASDRDAERSDDIFVWIPDERRVRRSPPTSVEGIFMPSYTRGNAPEMNRAQLPDGTSIPGSSIATVEHTRIGFTGLYVRPNAYRWKFMRVQDVIAPINVRGTGYPEDKERDYGPTGQSLGSEVWDIRRAVVIQGFKSGKEDPAGRVTLYVDALTQQPLYYVSRRSNGRIFEVGILAGRFSGDDPSHPYWVGSDGQTGVILPVFATFYTGRGTGWVRESFGLRSDPPEEEDARDFTTTIKLQRGR